MNPNIFIEEERTRLFRVFCDFARKNYSGSGRQAILTNAGVDKDFINGINVNAPPLDFANELLSQFLTFTVSQKKPSYHPLLCFIQYLLATQPLLLKDEEQRLLKIIESRGERNMKVLAILPAVGRIEAPLNNAIGTSILIASNILLTCSHIFDSMVEQRIWVRFGHTQENEHGIVYELETDFISNHPRPDHALLKLKETPPQRPIYPKPKVLDEGQSLAIIHYPQGYPLQVSDTGYIIEVATNYIDHTLPVEKGSSGAPIFDQNWQFVALHRGRPSTHRSILSGSTEAVPLTALKSIFEKHLPNYGS